MTSEISSVYSPKEFENKVSKKWLDSKAFSAVPDKRPNPYTIMMPPPNVTGALHMGHAMGNVMQDLLIRWHRMQGFNTLWMPGTDHAGIATQAVVEKRLKELEGKTRHDIGREALVQKIWEWKDFCQNRINSQQQEMGCSSDWDRQRFTLDDVCAKAVCHTFFKLFKDNLIYQGKRLVNWDCVLRTAVSDDELEHKLIQGHFWHLKYPVIDPKPGEPEFVVIATTRPETMLADTAVACHPNPAKQLDELIAKASDQVSKDALIERKKTHLATLELLAAMAADGRKVMLPIQNRAIPIITDTWAKPEMGSGCVKITPAHDPNDYEVWTRNSDKIGIINILNQDGTFNQNAGKFNGVDRFVARKQILKELESLKLVHEIEDREIELAHSDRSKTPIEPYLSLQWFVRMGDVDGGIVCGAGTKNEFKAKGLAQAAMDAVTEGKVSFHPEKRYASTYLAWLTEKRDWCISRQLWWGHQISIWSKNDSVEVINKISANLKKDERLHSLVRAEDDGSSTLLVCIRYPQDDSDLVQEVEQLGLVRDPDVLDTWFSSAIWPFSTLGWPDPNTAKQDSGQPSLQECLDYYYPTSCLVTGRDIITLWVVRMVLAGLYALGEIPFKDVFIHASILDGNGDRMSKSKGNGIDPVDLINRYGTDAMRYILCEMQTGLQDIRLPVQVESPFTGKILDLHNTKHGSSIFTYICPDSGKEFDVLGTMEGMPAAAPFSTRFEEGQKNCNKIWNAARFAAMNLKNEEFTPLDVKNLATEDRWILSRMSKCVTLVQNHLKAYNPSFALDAAREFFRGDFCDWYLEIIKSRVQEDKNARQLLAACLDYSLRLMHPFLPFITEELWSQLNQTAPKRAIDKQLDVSEILAVASWPTSNETWIDESLEKEFGFCQEVVRAIRNIRSKYGLSPALAFSARIKASGANAEFLKKAKDLLVYIGKLADVEISEDAKHTPDCATIILGEITIYLPGVVDIEKESERLNAQLAKLEKKIEASRKKLDNEGFVARALPAVVEKEKEILSDLEKEKAGISESIRLLQA